MSRELKVLRVTAWPANDPTIVVNRWLPWVSVEILCTVSLQTFKKLDDSALLQWMLDHECFQPWGLNLRVVDVCEGLTIIVGQDDEPLFAFSAFH
mgnify:CR=1 FL=1